MAESRHRRAVFWVDPDVRGIVPLDGLHVSRSLQKTVRRGTYEIRCDTAFPEVIAACAAPGRGREDTWINGEIARAYTELFAMGFVHTVEAWREGRLAGGLYGVALGGAFFGESMFSVSPDASKVALVHLVARLRLGGFVLLDTQFVTDHLRRLGAVEIAARDYLVRLEQALRVRAAFPLYLAGAEGGAALEGVLRQSRTQTS